MFPQNFKKNFEVLHMLRCHLSLHHHVVYIYLNSLAQLWFKHPRHHHLVSGSRIFQAEGHYFVIVISSGVDEGCLLLIV